MARDCQEEGEEEELNNDAVRVETMKGKNFMLKNVYYDDDKYSILKMPPLSIGTFSFYLYQ